MLIKILVIFLCLCICIDCHNSIQFIRRGENANVTSDSSETALKSFNRLEKKLNHFFRITISKPTEDSQCEKVRRKVKKALHNFVNEIFYDVTTNKPKIRKLIDKASKEAQRFGDLLILQHGYQAKPHRVLTQDGYVLSLYRLIHNSEKSTTGRKNTVILHHGLMGCSDDWLHLGPKKGLPYLLNDAGYDVWLTNARGSKYSRLHTNYSENSSEFWNFSFHEIGTVDLPAVIDYVKNNSVSDSEIDFFGFSMGATALLVLLSSMPQYNRVLKSATLLAPLAFMYKIRGPLKLLAEFHEESAGNSLNFLGVNEFMAIEAFPQQVIEKFCRGDDRLCLNPFILIANGGKKIKNNKVLRNVLSHLPAGASVKTFMHYLQLINSGEFQMYDYGTSINLKKYKNKTPPSYNLGNVTLPIIIISSYDDWLSTKTNVLRLLPLLPDLVVHHVVKNQNFSHTDFIWGEEAPEQVYHLVIEILGQLYEGRRLNTESTSNK